MGRATWAWAMAGVGVGVSMLVAQSTRPANPTTSDTPNVIARWTTQLIVPTSDTARLSVTDGVAGKTFIYAYQGDLNHLRLERTIDLTAAGASNLQAVEISAPPESVAAIPAKATTRPTPSPKEKVIERVVVKADGSFVTSGDLTVSDQDLPLFAKKMAGPDRVVVVGGDLPLTELVKACDRLKAAGVPDVAIASSPNDPSETYSTSVTMKVDGNGLMYVGVRSLPDDAAVALFVKEIVGDRNVRLYNWLSEKVPLPVMLKTIDRLKAAGVKKVVVTGLAESP